MYRKKQVSNSWLTLNVFHLLPFGLSFSRVVSFCIAVVIICSFLSVLAISLHISWVSDFYG